MSTRRKSVRGLRLALLLGVLFLPATAIPAAETTVYVNKHFEVRDRDQPVKYIFNSDTRIARVTGSLSTNTRVQRLRLRPGWNSAALAVTALNALGQLTNSQPATLSSVFQWDQPAQSWRSVQPNETLSAGTVLWLHAITNATIALTGTYSDPTNRTIASGSTFLPNTGLEATSLLGLSSNVALSTFEASEQQWFLRQPVLPHADPGFPNFIVPGSAVFAWADAPAELEIPDAALRIRYYHQDHLESASTITDAAGSLVVETAYYPFGPPRNEHRLRQIENGAYRFTQKERDAESGLAYFHSRFLSSSLARFIRVDTLAYNMPAGWLGQPQKLNTYSYVGNNPLKFVDPTGMDGEKPNSSKPKNQVLVMYGEDQYTEFHKGTGQSRAFYEQSLKATYSEEAGNNANVVVKRLALKRKEDLAGVFKGGAYDVIVYNGHGGSAKKEIYPGGGVAITPDDMHEALSEAKLSPKKVFLYGCNTEKSGFVRVLSELRPNTEVTGSGNRIGQEWKWDGGPGGTRRNFRIVEDRDHNITYKGGKETLNVRKRDDPTKAELPRP